MAHDKDEARRRAWRQERRQEGQFWVDGKGRPRRPLSGKAIDSALDRCAHLVGVYIAESLPLGDESKREEARRQLKVAARDVAKDFGRRLVDFVVDGIQGPSKNDGPPTATRRTPRASSKRPRAVR